MKVAHILSYKFPNYVRSDFIVQCLESVPEYTVYRAVNSKTGFLRYIQTIAKLVYLRTFKHPDVYILGFRGIEIFWIVRLITLGKPLVYDEFINPYLWFVEEHKKFPPKSIRAKLLRLYTKGVLDHSDFILSDTDRHLNYTSQEFNIKKEKMDTIYVGTNEQLFKPLNDKTDKSKDFIVFFYGNFLQLHGLDYILGAAELLKTKTDIKFVIVGGANRKKQLEDFLKKLKKMRLNNVQHISWINFEEIPKYVGRANLCLGGPFGNSPQAKNVITGKTYQFLAMAAPTVVGKIDEQTGFLDKRNCLVVKQGSALEIARTIEWAYKNTDKLRIIGLNGRKLYDHNFSIIAQTNKLKSIIEKVTN